MNWKAVLKKLIEKTNDRVKNPENIKEKRIKYVKEQLEKMAKQYNAKKEEIENIYGNPMEVLRDLVKACELLDLGISSNKYDNINEMAIHMIGSSESH